MATKECVGCGYVLPIDAFYLVRVGEELRQSRCKRCDNAARSRNMRRGAHGPEVVRRPDGSLVVVRVRGSR
jgi:hypothetical protein